MTTSTPPQDSGDADDVPRSEFRLLVWIHPQQGWRARIVGIDAVARDFASPFELARFVAWPLPAPAPARRSELR